MDRMNTLQHEFKTYKKLTAIIIEDMAKCQNNLIKRIEDLERSKIDTPVVLKKDKVLGPLTDWKWLKAGKAIFTIEGEKEDEHWTFKVCHKKANVVYGETWFVQLLTGQDNESSYSYLGILRADGSLSQTLKSFKAPRAVNVFNQTIPSVKNDTHKGRIVFKFKRSIQCCVCARRLTTPESITAGIGPECSKY